MVSPGLSEASACMNESNRKENDLVTVSYRVV